MAGFHPAARHGEAMKHVSTAATWFVLAFAAQGFAADLPAPGEVRFEPKLEYIMSYTVKLDPPQVLGELPEGLRVIAYVSTGSFKGPNLEGKILPGGGDWLTIRRDGIGILDVRATFETKDGALIYISYTGVLDLGPDGYRNFTEGKAPGLTKLKVSSRLHTASAKYQWLNRSQYVQFGEFDSDKLLVRYDVYAMKGD
jgi:hypothetical protein